MSHKLTLSTNQSGQLTHGGKPLPPAFRDIAASGVFRRCHENTKYFLAEYLLSDVRNENTRAAYARRIADFLMWCDAGDVDDLRHISSVMVSDYLAELAEEMAPSTVKQALAALRMMYNHLIKSPTPVTYNPAQAVSGPKLVIREGKTPALTGEQVCDLFDSIETDTIIGLRDRALIGTMLYTFARVSAALKMNVGDYFQSGKRSMSLRLKEKGGKPHSVPAHLTLQRYLDAYIDKAGIGDEKDSALFRTVDRSGNLTGNRLKRQESLAMLKRRAARAGLPPQFSHHWLRATGITEFLEQDGALENAQRIANHADSRTTKLYDRRGRRVTQEEIQRLRFERTKG